MRNHASIVALFDTNDNDVNEQKIVNMASRSNGVYVDVANNDDTGVTPRGHAASYELRPSTSPTDANDQSTMEALTKDCNNSKLPPISITT